MKKNLRIAMVGIVSMAVMPFCFSSTVSAAPISVYSEDFDAFTTGAIGGQNGWTATVGTPQILVGDSGGTDKVVGGTNSDAQGNVSNTNLYSLAATTTQVIFEARMRMRSGNGNRVNFVGSAGTDIVGFGAGFGGFNFVVVNAADTKLYTGNAPGGNALGGSHEWYDVIFTVDFNKESDATGTYAVRKDGQASFSTLTSGLDLGLSAFYENPANWSGLLLELRTASNQQDDFQLSAVVPAPEPTSFVLAMFGLAGIGALGRRRRRRV